MRSSGLWVGVVGAGVIGWAGVAGAAVTVTPPVLKDNTLLESSTGSLSNAKGSIFAGRTNQVAGSSIRRGLIAFDLSSIPAGATVTSASLKLTALQTRALSATNMSLFRVAKDWGEGTSSGQGSGGAATTGDATWLNTFFPSQTWTSAGGDFASTASATTSVLGLGDKTWSGGGMVADVQAWLANPSSNFGWELVGDESAGSTSYEFGSRESLSGQPVLTVTYDAAVPEPGAVALVAAVIPLLGRRRRARVA